MARITSYNVCYTKLLRLPAVLKPHTGKLFGLVIDAHRLQQIREQRRPNSRYSSLPQCREEVRRIQQLFRSERIPFV